MIRRSALQLINPTDESETLAKCLSKLQTLSTTRLDQSITKQIVDLRNMKSENSGQHTNSVAAITSLYSTSERRNYRNVYKPVLQISVISRRLRNISRVELLGDNIAKHRRDIMAIFHNIKS